MIQVNEQYDDDHIVSSSLLTNHYQYPRDIKMSTQNTAVNDLKF